MSPPSPQHPPFTPAGPSDSRSPCPALNALANHGYISHDGRNIPFFTLINVLRHVYRVSYPLALLLTVVGFIWCGHFARTSSQSGLLGLLSYRLHLDLHDLAKHNHIEHDGSFGHADALPGEEYAPNVPDKRKLKEVLDSATASVSTSAYSDEPRMERRRDGTMPALTLSNLSLMRYRRDAALGAHQLDRVHAAIARGEVALIMLTFGDKYPPPSSSTDSKSSPVSTAPPSNLNSDSDETLVRCDWLAQWIGEERLPEGWTQPRTKLGLLKAAGIANNVLKEVTSLGRYMG